MLTFNFLSDSVAAETLTLDCTSSSSENVELSHTFSNEPQSARTPYRPPSDQKVVLPCATNQLSAGSIPPNIEGSGPLIPVPSTALPSSPNCCKFAVVYPPNLPTEQTLNLTTEMITGNVPYAVNVSSFPLYGEPVKLVPDPPVGTNEDTSQPVDRLIDNESLEDYSEWLLQNTLVTDFDSNSDDQKGSRKQKFQKRRRPCSFYTACGDPSFAQQQDSYRPDNFWCPLCRFLYTSSFCPHHPITEHTSPTVTSFARLSKPNCIQLVERAGVTRTRLIKRQPALTRFGPLIAPILSEDEVTAHPDWLLECPFRLEVFDPESGLPSVRYLRVGNEALCNWMMFVRLVQQSSDQLISCRDLPNAVAYQQGSDGIFFLTTRQLRSGQELVVTYSPPYAARFGFSHSLIQIDPLPDTGGSALGKELLPHAATSTKTNTPDEIHCFVCSLTFTSEDAFRVHCLGHPGEMDQRGISSNTKKVRLFACALGDPSLEADSTVIEIQKPKQTASSRCSSSINKTVYFQSVLRCSSCAIEVDGLSELVQHTNSQHSMLTPRVFRWEASNSKVRCLENAMFNTDWGQSQSANYRSTCEVPAVDNTPTEGLVVVDLGRFNRRLHDSPLHAYGCGQCYQRFPDMHALEQHKDAKHSVAFRENITEGEALRPLYNQISINHTDEIQRIRSGTAYLPTSIDSISNNNSESWNNAVIVTSSVTYACDDLAQTNTFTENSTSPSAVATSPTFECCVCGFEVRTRSALSVHMRSHSCRNDKPCPSSSDKHSVYSSTTLCPGALSSTGLNNQSREDKPMFFRCRVCGEGQRSQRALREHGLKHQRPSDLMYPCILCPKDLKQAHETFQQLQRHIRFVHPSQIFPCPYCNSTFGRRKNLNNHLVHHTGRRDFPCPHNGCSKAYSRKDKLKEHLRMHKGHPPNPGCR